MASPSSPRFAPLRRPNVGIAPEGAAHGEPIFRAGGLPLGLSPGVSMGLTDTELGRFGALWVTGGGGESHATQGLIRRALAARVPLLATGEGLLLLNAALGGTTRDLPPGSGVTEHWQRHRPDQPQHPVDVREGTLLAACVGRGNLMVNSTHRQTVDALGEGLAVSAVAPDGTVEAVELKTASFALGVHWEPDRLLTALPLHRSLYEVLVGRARER